MEICIGDPCLNGGLCLPTDDPVVFSCICGASFMGIICHEGKVILSFINYILYVCIFNLPPPIPPIVISASALFK